MTYRSVSSTFLALFLIVAGCDPGYSYRQVASDGTLISQGKTDLGSVTVTYGGFDILTGSGSMLQTMQVRNDSGADVVLLGGTLTAEKKSLTALLPGKGEAHWRTVSPGETKEIACLFDFWSAGGVAQDILTQSIRLKWELQVGNEVKQIEVPLKRLKQ